MTYYQKSANRDCPEVFDYIVCGLGTAGESLARKLSADLSTSVLLLGREENKTLIPTGSQIREYSRGSVNEWNRFAAQAGVSEWTYSNMVPAFVELENYTGTTSNPAQRGKNGPYPIAQDALTPFTPQFFSAIQDIVQTPTIVDYNIDIEFGASNLQTFTPAILPQLPKLWIHNDCFVDRVLIDREFIDPTQQEYLQDELCGHEQKTIKQPKAVGVRYLQGSAFKFAFAKKRVIVCAGAQSSAILQRSGVGDVSLLTFLKIPVIHNSPNVGRNTITPYGTNLYVSTSTDTSALENVGVAFIQDPTNPSFIRQEYISVSEGIRPDRSSLPPTSNLTNATTLTFRVLNLEPTSRGSLLIQDKSIVTPPIVQPGFYTTDTDLVTARTLVRNTVSVINRMNQLNPSFNLNLQYPTQDVVNNDTLLSQFLTTQITSSPPYAGSNRIDPNPTLGVVDGYLRVYGVDNLSVCDASVFPFSMGQAYPAVDAGLGWKYAELVRSLDNPKSDPCEIVISCDCSTTTNTTATTTTWGNPTSSCTETEESTLPIAEQSQQDSTSQTIEHGSPLGDQNSSSHGGVVIQKGNESVEVAGWGRQKPKKCRAYDRYGPSDSSECGERERKPKKPITKSKKDDFWFSGASFTFSPKKKSTK